MSINCDDNKPKKTNCHAGHRKRLYETLKACNFDPVQSHIMLEYILFQVFPVCDTNPIAHRLINKFGSFSNVFDAKFEDLIKVEGIGETAARKILTYKQFLNYYTKHKTSMKVKLQNPIDFVNYFGDKIRKSKTENLLVIILNDSYEIKSFDIFEGEKDNTINFDARDIYEVARKSDGSLIVLMHNHPSGDATPSEADVKNTEILYEKLINFRVEIADHIIVSENSYFSFDRNNLLNGVRERCGRLNLKAHKTSKI
ncbi:MAG: JAB domain-containing protein [Christensenellales bacterium]